MLGGPHEAAQRLVDQRLITAAPGLVNLRPEPLKNVIVDTDRDTRLAGRRTNDGAAVTVSEVVLLLHLIPSYSRRSRAVALRAETKHGWLSRLRVHDYQDPTKSVHADRDEPFLVRALVRNG
jgi:hypothetical protein